MMQQQQQQQQSSVIAWGNANPYQPASPFATNNAPAAAPAAPVVVSTPESEDISPTPSAFLLKKPNALPSQYQMPAIPTPKSLPQQAQDRYKQKTFIIFQLLNAFLIFNLNKLLKLYAVHSYDSYKDKPVEFYKNYYKAAALFSIIQIGSLLYSSIFLGFWGYPLISALMLLGYTYFAYNSSKLQTISKVAAKKHEALQEKAAYAYLQDLANEQENKGHIIIDNLLSLMLVLCVFLEPVVDNFGKTVAFCFAIATIANDGYLAWKTHQNKTNETTADEENGGSVVYTILSTGMYLLLQLGSFFSLKRCIQTESLKEVATTSSMSIGL